VENLRGSRDRNKQRGRKVMTVTSTPSKILLSKSLRGLHRRKKRGNDPEGRVAECDKKENNKQLIS